MEVLNDLCNSHVENTQETIHLSIIPKMSIIPKNIFVLENEILLEALKEFGYVI